MGSSSLFYALFSSGSFFYCNVVQCSLDYVPLPLVESRPRCG